MFSKPNFSEWMRYLSLRLRGYSDDQLPAQFLPAERREGRRSNSPATTATAPITEPTTQRRRARLNGD